MSRTWATLGVAVGVGLAVVTAGCGAPAASPPAPETVTVTAPAPVEPRPASSAATPAAGGTPRCTTAGLSAALGEGDAAAGSVTRPLVFTNTGAAPCELRGFPGVSYVAGADGHQVGPAAQETGERAGEVVLRPGGKAQALVAVCAGRELRRGGVPADARPRSAGLPAGRHRLAVRGGRRHRLRGNPARAAALRPDGRS